MEEHKVVNRFLELMLMMYRIPPEIAESVGTVPQTLLPPHRSVIVSIKAVTEKVDSTIATWLVEELQSSSPKELVGFAQAAAQVGSGMMVAMIKQEATSRSYQNSRERRSTLRKINTASRQMAIH